MITFVTLVASAQKITCRTNSAGIDYKDGVKQCRYFCTDGCNETQVIGPGFEGDFGAFNCHGAIIQIQPSMNGQLSPNAVGFKDFTLSLSGVAKYWSAIRYGALQKIVARAYQGQICQQR